MEYSINLYFPLNGNTDHIIVSKDNSFDDIQEYIVETYNIYKFNIIFNNIEITKSNFSPIDDMTLRIMPSIKSGRDIISRQINLQSLKTFRKVNCICDSCKKLIPNKRSYISPPEVSQKYIRNFDRDELENLGKKYRIAMEEAFKREEEQKKENQKIHKKIMDLRDKIRKSKEKKFRRINGIREEPKKAEQDNYCGFKKGFLI